MITGRDIQQDVAPFFIVNSKITPYIIKKQSMTFTLQLFIVTLQKFFK